VDSLSVTVPTVFPLLDFGLVERVNAFVCHVLILCDFGRLGENDSRPALRYLGVSTQPRSESCLVTGNARSVGKMLLGVTWKRL
jgi:hypothetical protein